MFAIKTDCLDRTYENFLAVNFIFRKLADEYY